MEAVRFEFFVRPNFKGDERHYKHKAKGLPKEDDHWVG